MHGVPAMLTGNKGLYHPKSSAWSTDDKPVWLVPTWVCLKTGWFHQNNSHCQSESSYMFIIMFHEFFPSKLAIFGKYIIHDFSDAPKSNTNLSCVIRPFHRWAQGAWIPASDVQPLTPAKVMFDPVDPNRCLNSQLLHDRLTWKQCQTLLDDRHWNIYIYIHNYVYQYVCMYVCMHACMHVCMYKNVTFMV